MRNKFEKHPYMLALVSILLMVGCFIGSSVLAGIQDRFSDIDLKPTPDNYIRLPDVQRPSKMFAPEVRTDPFVNSLVAGTTMPGQTGRTLTSEVPSGEAWLANNGGNLMYKGEVQLPLAGRTVLIDSVKDLTFLKSGISAVPTSQYSSDSGNSVFWLEWGNHYIVDPYQIAYSGGTKNPVQGTTYIPLTEVSGIFRSVLKDDDRKTITVEIAQTGVTGYAELTGITPVSLWAPLNSGATSYDGNGGNMMSGITIANGDSGVTHQTMLLTTGNGVMQITGALNGGVNRELKKMGDRIIFIANYNAGISVVPISKYIEKGDSTRKIFETAHLSGSTGTIQWSGVVGWSLTTTNMKDYLAFMVDPSAITGAAYTDNCPVGRASTGATVTVPSITEEMHGLEWKFTNALGTTAFVLYRNATDCQFKNVGSGSTQAPSGNAAFNANSGATSIPDGLSDSVTIKAIYSPREVSGYYVTNMYIDGK